MCDKARRRGEVVVLPNPKDQPACLQKTPVRILVPLLVRFDLATPEFGIRFRPGAMRGAAVPEASINEYSDTGRNKSQVGTTKQARQKLVVDTVAESLEAND